jgi:hypothetical protein
VETHAPAHRPRRHGRTKRAGPAYHPRSCLRTTTLTSPGSSRYRRYHTPLHPASPAPDNILRLYVYQWGLIWIWRRRCFRPTQDEGGSGGGYTATDLGLGPHLVNTFAVNGDKRLARWEPPTGVPDEYSPYEVRCCVTLRARWVTLRARWVVCAGGELGTFHRVHGRTACEQPRVLQIRRR